MKNALNLIRRLFDRNKPQPNGASDIEALGTLEGEQIKRVYLAENCPASEPHIRIDIVFCSERHLLAYISNIWMPEAMRVIKERLAVVSGELCPGTDGWREHWALQFVLESELDRRTKSFAIQRPESRIEFSWKMNLGRLNSQEISDDSSKSQATLVEAVVLTLLETKLINGPLAILATNVFPALGSCYGELSDER